MSPIVPLAAVLVGYTDSDRPPNYQQRGLRRATALLVPMRYSLDIRQMIQSLLHRNVSPDTFPLPEVELWDLDEN